MRSTLSRLQSVIAGAMVTADATVRQVSTDSRNLPAGSLFVALRGERFDAHDFLDAVQDGPVAAIMVERMPATLKVPALVVPDTRTALGDIARDWRRQFAIPVIGVTGSNGKTTVKEMIASILAAAFGEQGYLATRGNFNNDIGVPLTLFRLQAGHQAAVIELGMNHPGEIAQLTSIASPTVGLVNNAQREHQEFMESVEAVAKENGAIIAGLPADGVAVFPADDPFSPLWHDVAASVEGRSVITFGLSGDADVRCTHEPTGFGNLMQVGSPAGAFEVKLAAAGTHNVRNALAAIACTHAIGVRTDAIIAGLEAFQPVSGRLQRKQAATGAAVIDDTYNANPDSVRAAIDVLAGFPAPRLLVLGEMGEVGDEGQQFHEEIGSYAKERGIDSLLTIGTLAQFASTAFGAGARHCQDEQEIGDATVAFAKSGTTVLVKGSRFMKMERIIGRLTGGEQQESH
jgi:UDP-N-acetylmuramoyl-tripeptide--D-alanyl-D-alanine ligase